MSEITKEELMMMLDVQGKNVQQITIVAEQLKSIAETNRTIVAKLTNGMSSDLKDVKSAVCGSEKEEGIKKTCEGIRDNTKKSALYVGFIAGAVVVALAIMQFVHWTSHINEPDAKKPKVDINKVVEGLSH